MAGLLTGTCLSPALRQLGAVAPPCVRERVRRPTPSVPKIGAFAAIRNGAAPSRRRLSGLSVTRQRVLFGLPRNTKGELHAVAMDADSRVAHDIQERLYAGPVSKRLFDQPALHHAIDEQRERLGLTWAQVARTCHVAPSTVRRLLSSGAAEADGVLGLVRWLGLAPEQFLLPAPVVAPPIGPGRLNTQALFAALDQRRASRGLSWSDVAVDVYGGTAASVRALARGGRVGIDALMAYLAWLDLPAAAFVDPTFDHPGERPRRFPRGG